MSPASYQTAPPRVAMESGKRASTPRPHPWQGCALPTELFPRASANLPAQWGSVSRPRHQPCRPLPPLPPFSGGEGDRTPDLVNAIHALSQLSYAPYILPAPERLSRPAGTRHLIGAFGRGQAISRLFHEHFFYPCVLKSTP